VHFFIHRNRSLIIQTTALIIPRKLFQKHYNVGVCIKNQQNTNTCCAKCSENNRIFCNFLYVVSVKKQNFETSFVQKQFLDCLVFVSQGVFANHLIHILERKLFKCTVYCVDLRSFSKATAAWTVNEEPYTLREEHVSPLRINWLHMFSCKGAYRNTVLAVILNLLKFLQLFHELQLFHIVWTRCSFGRAQVNTRLFANEYSSFEQVSTFGCTNYALFFNQKVSVINSVESK